MAQAYVIVTQVSDHQPGEVVAFSDEQLKNGVSIERLTSLGAIRQADADEVRLARPFGQADPQNVVLEVPQVTAPTAPETNAQVAKKV